MTEQEREQKQARLKELEDEAIQELVACSELDEHMPPEKLAEYERLYKELFPI